MRKPITRISGVYVNRHMRKALYGALAIATIAGRDFITIADIMRHNIDVPLIGFMQCVNGKIISRDASGERYSFTPATMRAIRNRTG